MRVFVIAVATRRQRLSQPNPFHGVARLVPFRVVELGVRAPGPGPGRNDDLEALPRPPRVAGVAVLGPICDQAGQRRVRPGCPQGPDLGVVGARAVRHAQAQGTARRSVRMWIWVRLRRLRARARPCCPATRRTDLDRPACICFLQAEWK